MVREKGFIPHGIEVSQEAVWRGRSRLSHLAVPDISLKHWETRPYLDFPDNHFQLIYGLQCIYYNLEIETVLEEVSRCLKKDGIFAFSFFSKSHDYYKYSKLVEAGDLYDIREWSDDHPSYRIRGARLVAPKSRGDLLKLFERFSEVRVFKEETDFSPMFNSWWYVYGKK